MYPDVTKNPNVSECIQMYSNVSKCIGMYPNVSTDPVRGTTEAGGTLSTEQSQILPTWYVSRLELLGCKS